MIDTNNIEELRFHIQIKMFDDHMTVESPGQLPGLVRPNNMREMHFSRNPKIIEFLHVYEYVKEFGEGVDRMYREMEDAGLPDPEYQVSSFMLCATLKNQKWVAAHQQAGQVAPPSHPPSRCCNRRKDIGILFCSTFSCRIT